MTKKTVKKSSTRLFPSTKVVDSVVKLRVRHPIPTISFPADLPVSERHTEIAKAINDHQVVIICGETGSGKTTQLPKICLQLGRGDQGLIAHTQPRRIAAVSVAKRIAQELNTPLGEVVGYQVRFQDKTQEGASVKLMTDGILLAQSQHDPLFKAYDTIIIDEAHERSLNIDFLLGYLKQILPKRPDLKVIITSATIDAERFARHFTEDTNSPVPVLQVSGRMYPVEVRYRPVLDESEEGQNTNQAGKAEKDLYDSLLEAVDECLSHGSGDILVFMPGEREIRESTEALQKQYGVKLDLLPLYSRLSQSEQERVFQDHSSRRRVVLATNVAETSITVPGIRYVIDSGLARVKRYSWRNKVEQLNLESISQASANQRAGRCGRVGPGVCIRLYSEEDFVTRPAFPDPEILRSSLASVILRMKSLRLHDIERFPFLQAPLGRAIADGYQLLQELGALNADNRLTATGKQLARLPLDPRLAKMILSAQQYNCLQEILIITAALSVQDPRERPLEAQEAADQAQQSFFDERSEFISYLKIWNWYHEQYQRRESQRKFMDQVRAKFLSPLRMREWKDVYTQLLSVVAEQSWQLNQSAATHEQIHLALLSGLLGNVGFKSEDNQVYLGARGIRFVIHPGSRLQKKAGRWLVAAELVETSRLFARGIAKIEPQWVEKVASHLLTRAWSDPRWDEKTGQVVANERATLYGLPVYQGRRVSYAKINADESREIFIRQALVAGEMQSTLPFFAHNLRLIAAIEKMEHQARRPDILVDETLVFAFYEQHLPPDICRQQDFENWYKQASQQNKQLLFLNKEALMRHEAQGITTEVFPKSIDCNGTNLALDYHFEPGSPKDGVTLTIPIFVLNQLSPERFEWLVPGMLKEKVQLLLKSLPQKLRRHCVPLPDYAKGFYDRWFDRLSKPTGTLIDAIAQDVREQLGVMLSATDFKIENLPSHLLMNFRLVDEHGRVLGMERHLAKLKAIHAKEAQSSFQQLATKDKDVAQVIEQEAITSWSFGVLPELLEIKRKGIAVIGYPALIDKTTHCELDVFDDLEEAQRHHRQGLLRLFRLQLKDQVKFLTKNIPQLTQMGMLFMGEGTQEDLIEQIIDKAISQACLQGPLPNDETSFETLKLEAKGRIGLLVQELSKLILTILSEWSAANKKLVQLKAHKEVYLDIQTQLTHLVNRTFIAKTPYAQLVHYPRYLKAVQVRVDKFRVDLSRDKRLMLDWQSVGVVYQRILVARKGRVDEHIMALRWALEELRVALFAQELRTPMPVSVKRLQKMLETLR